MGKGRKIRNLVESDSISMTLDDVIQAAVKLSHPLIDLEYGNKKTHYASARDLVSDLEKKTKALGQRIRGEVFEEVHTHAKENNTKYKGNVDYLRKKE